MSKTLQDDKNSLEVDKNDLNRKLSAQEEKVNQLMEQKSKLQRDLEMAQSSTLDINSEVSKLNNDLRTKQGAFEAFQNEAETAKLNLQRRVDELERQNGLKDQQCSKLKEEMDALQAQKIESENQLNQELQNIKSSSDQEKAELEQELRKLRSSFDIERIQLNREKQAAQEEIEKIKDEFEAKIRDLQSTIENLQSQIESARKQSKESQSSMGTVVDDLKKREQQLAEELDGQRMRTDDLKKSLEQLQLSKDAQRYDYEEKLSLHKHKIAKLEEDFVRVEEQQKMAAANTDEKIKILDDIQAKCYEQEQKITNLTHQLENEKSLKTKMEANIQEQLKKFQEIEEEQIDLVNRKEQLKMQSEDLERQIEQLKSLHKSLENTLKLERVDSEQFRVASDEHIRSMESKINELEKFISEKDQDKIVVVEKLHRREDEIVQLQAAVKDLEDKLQKESDDSHKLLQGKDQEMLKMVHESTSKDTMISDLQNNLDNIQACLMSMTNDKVSTTDMVLKLNETVSSRDLRINELNLKVHSIEQLNKEIEDQMKNMMSFKDKSAGESQLKINDLLEQIAMLEEVKAREVQELSSNLELVKSQLNMYENASEASTNSLKTSRSRENELQLKIKDLELRENELLMLNQGLKRKNEELEAAKIVPKGEDYDQEMSAHIEFLNSIIADMQKKNDMLTQKVELLCAGSSGAHSE